MRWPTRQLQASIERHLRAALTDLGWLDPAHLHTESPVAWVPDHDPEGVVAGGGPKQPNLIGLSLGEVPDVVPQEMGGGVLARSIPVFLDIYGEDRSTAVNISDDIVAVLQGQLWTPSRYIPLYDHSHTPPMLVTTETVEARMVEARWPSATTEWRRRWRAVSFTATHYFQNAGADE